MSAGKGQGTLKLLSVAGAELDLVAALVAVGRAVLVKEVEVAARPDCHGTDRAARLRIVHQEAAELRFQAGRYSNQERSPFGCFPEVVLAVPGNRLVARARLERRRRTMYRRLYFCRRRRMSFPLGVLDGDGHVRISVQREVDCRLVARPNGGRLLRESRRSLGSGGHRGKT